MSIQGQLGSLEAAGLVSVSKVEPDLEYHFRHSLVQEVAYASLLEDDREELHLLVGETIEKIYPERLDEFAALLARHYRKAGKDDKAHSYYIKAGKNALESYANREAEIQFRRALSLTCCETERAALLYGLGESLYRQSHFQEAIDSWKEGIVLYKEAERNNEVARLYARSARVAWHMGDNPEALRLSKEGLEIVAGTADSPEMAMLIHEAARSCLFNGLHEKAYNLCEKALRMAEKFDDIAGQADTLATYGVLKGLSTEEALEALEKSVELAEEAGYLGIAMRAYHNLATITGEQEGGREASRKYFKKAAALGRKRGVAVEEHYSLSGAIGYARAAGNLVEVEEYLERMDELSRVVIDPAPLEYVNNGHRAALLFMQGKWEEAVDLMRSCYIEARTNQDLVSMQEIGGDLVSALIELNLYDQLDDWTEAEGVISERIKVVESGTGDKMWPYLHLTIIRSRQMRIPEAREALAQANMGERKRDSIWRENYIGHAEGELATAEGRNADATSTLEKVAAIYARLGAKWSWARTLHDWAEVHMKNGAPADYERARALIREAQALYESMGAERHAKWMETRLSVLRTKTFNLALASQRDARELARAAEIQGSFLPDVLPDISGWELAVTLEPARQTSGDFYDFIPLGNNRWGIVVADVADKGTAAALFMTTTQSLIRTYADEYKMWPEVVLSETNRRLLADTRSGIFVTAFYGILDPSSGLLTYANAGHNPPYLLMKDNVWEMLNRTGTPLGIFPEASWEKSEVKFSPGDSLVVYTDGVIDSQNSDEELFGDKCFQDSLREYQYTSATTIRDGILKNVHDFVGEGLQFDDITLVVMKREEGGVERSK